MKNLLLISASAGSGKTYTLTEKITQLVVSGAVEPGKIIATTFTVKAANELKSRIREALIKAGKTREANMLNESLIGTINSVGLALLKKYAFYAGLSPRLETLEEEEANLILEELLGESIDEKFLQLAEKMCQNGSSFMSARPEYLDHIQKIISDIRSNGMSEDQLPEFAKTSLQKSFEGIPILEYSKFKTRLINILKDILEVASGRNLTPNQNSQVEELRNICQLLVDDKDIWDNWRKLADYKNLVSIVGADRLENLRNAASGVIGIGKFREDYGKYVTGCFEAAGRCLDEYARVKAIKGLLDFTDQDALLYDMLRTNDRVKKAISGDYQLVVVDEFQDVSPIQLAIFIQMTELVGKNIWVGDPKQCIYAFRGADPELMTSVIAKVPAEQREILNKSYRSRKELVYYSNTIFKEVFEPGMKEAEIVLEPADPKVTGRNPEKEKDWPNAVQYWRIENGKIEYLAEAIEQFLMANPSMSYKDIAILCRKNTSATKVAEELGQLKLPVAIGGKGLRYEPEVIVLCACMKLLEYPNDPLAKAEILLHCVYNGDHGRMIEGRLSAENVYAWEKENEWFKRVEEVRKISRDFSVLRAVEVLISRLDIGSLLASWGNVEARMANLDQLMMYAGKYGNMALSGFLTWLDKEDTNEKLENGVPGGNNIQIMTYHKSKGLEWPMVILYDLNENLKDPLMGVKVVQDEDWSVESPLEKRSLILNIWPFHNSSNFVAYQEAVKTLKIWQDAQAMQKREEQRLFYVGVTRPRDYLVWLSNPQKDTEFKVPDLVNTKIGVRNMTDGEYRDKFSWREEPIPFSIKTFNTKDENYFAQKDARVDHSYYGAEGVQRGAYEWVKNNPSMEGRAKGMEVSQVVELGMPLEVEREAMDSKTFGTMVHRVMCGYRGEHSREENLKMIGGFSEQSEILMEGIERLMGYVGDGEMERELPVSWMMEDGGIVNGVMDMMIRREDGIEIMDYKTMRVDDVVGKALEYSGQLKRYGEVVEQVYGEEVSAYSVYFIMEGKVVKMKL
jgi:ATP-dependent helicase/nuclease subunit A